MMRARKREIWKLHFQGQFVAGFGHWRAGLAQMGQNHRFHRPTAGLTSAITWPTCRNPTARFSAHPQSLWRLKKNLIILIVNQP
jgi:hypothetical protein